jgi:hypothetical protein
MTIRMKFRRIAIDTSKHVFTLHGFDEQERPVLRRELRRGQVETFFGKQMGQPPRGRISPGSIGRAGRVH